MIVSTHITDTVGGGVTAAQSGGGGSDETNKPQQEQDSSRAFSGRSNTNISTASYHGTKHDQSGGNPSPALASVNTYNSGIHRLEECEAIEFTLSGRAFNPQLLCIVADWDLDQENLSELR
jgi:hypothetical protein